MDTNLNAIQSPDVTVVVHPTKPLSVVLDELDKVGLADAAMLAEGG